MTEPELLELCKSEMGWPVIRPLQKDDDIVKLILKPALKKFFKWWPLEVMQDYAVTVGEVVGAPPPPDNAFGVLQWEFLDTWLNIPQDMSMGDPFMLAQRMNNLTINSNFMPNEETWWKQTVREDNRQTTIKYDDAKNVIRLYSNVTGTVAVRFACMGTAEDVPVKREEWLTKLAAIAFLRKEARIRGAATMQTGMEVNIEVLNDLADKYEEEMTDLIKKRVIPVIMWG